MKLKINLVEIGRFLICLGIALVGWLYMWNTGSIF